jgi:type IV pilus biogenesis protein PilP
MQNKYKKTGRGICFGAFFAVALAMHVYADSEVSADVYNPDGSLFQMIADLEQEKIVLQLEKEKAQLQLDMDRLAAEQARIKNEIDAMSGAGNTQAEALELERQRLELEKEKLESQRKNLENPEDAPAKSASANKAARPQVNEEQSSIQEKYRLIEIIGAGRQLFATVEDLASGQRKKISVGKTLDGYRVESVSMDEGVVLSKDGETATLGVRSEE